MSNDGTFTQLTYVEEDDNTKAEPYDVHPGLFSIIKKGPALALQDTTFVNDKILETLVKTKEVTDKIDCFFRNLHVYAEEGIEVAKRGVLLYGQAGCHAKGSQILMYDGSIKLVEDIKLNDLLMGPDSNPRTVLNLIQGNEPLVKVIPTKGSSFIVNINHMLHLKRSSGDGPEFIDISVKNWLEQTEQFKTKNYKLVRTGVDFESKNLPINPYILGTWLGDGHSDGTRITSIDNEIINSWKEYAEETRLHFNKVGNSEITYTITSHIRSGRGESSNSFLKNLQELELIKNKHIPKIFLTSDRTQRLQLLAGILDTDGSLTHSKGFDYISVSKILAEDVLFLARSLGFSAYLVETSKGCNYKGEYKEGIYYRMCISGHTNEIPTRIERKKASNREQVKDVLKTGFTVEMLEPNDYYGFTVDSDHLYLTSDFTIHHNCGKTTVINKVANDYIKDGKTAVIVWTTDKFESFQVKDFIKTFAYVGVEKLILIVEDIGGTEIDQSRMRSDASLLSLLDNQEKTFNIPVLILATTNYPANMMGNLTNRPQRFDDKIELSPPNGVAREALLKFFGKGRETPEALSLIASKKADGFTPAHIREIVIRSRIFEKTMSEVIKEMITEVDIYNKAFSKTNSVGIGFND